METLNTTNTNIKAMLIQMINKAIDNKWNSKKAAHVLQIPLSNISMIKRLNTANFSLDKLLMLLVRLDFEVKILINSKKTTS
ncbi:XRE family transcriptional regulator [Wolbachia endosymbiont of Folsomia candida]|uniref:XRE family transcriptional regulator n=1 Tax=Wolbachia endosymbiont of Folsomia candida TaxID=169402 RepID=UPI000B207498|nr:XRE family transcriptional regulator [Wolbachia endosymbiont of Folsomia candida]APR99036.1 hypothetical protein ASM33_07585 [Wolbachia endosymbiont of Folsomia candida]